MLVVNFLLSFGVKVTYLLCQTSLLFSSFIFKRHPFHSASEFSKIRSLADCCFCGVSCSQQSLNSMFLCYFFSMFTAYIGYIKIEVLLTMFYCAFQRCGI